MRLTDTQIEILFDAATCPKCGSAAETSGSGPCLAQSWWECMSGPRPDRSRCDWEGPLRELVEAALKRAGIELAEPWRSDEPPAGPIEVWWRDALDEHIQGGCVVFPSDGEVRQLVLYPTLGDVRRPSSQIFIGEPGDDFFWRPIGPNPLEGLGRARKGT